jgi:hypothetical protein
MSAKANREKIKIPTKNRANGSNEIRTRAEYSSCKMNEEVWIRESGAQEDPSTDDRAMRVGHRR